MFKKILALTMAIILAFASFSLITYAEYEPDYIYDQDDSSVRDIAWGLFGNTGDNGCGWVATYNVMVSKSENITKDLVIEGLTRNKAPLLFGILGAQPFGIKNYLDDYFEETHLYLFGKSEWGNYAEDCDGVIVLFASLKTGVCHYVAGIADENDEFCFFNTNYASYDSPVTVNDYISTICDANRLPIAFITVKNQKGNW